MTLKDCAERAGLGAHLKVKLVREDGAAAAFCRMRAPAVLRHAPVVDSVRVVDFGEEVKISKHIIRYSFKCLQLSEEITDRESFSCGDVDDRLNQEFVRFLSTRFRNFGKMVGSKLVPLEVTAVLA